MVSRHRKNSDLPDGDRGLDDCDSVMNSPFCHQVQESESGYSERRAWPWPAHVSFSICIPQHIVKVQTLIDFRVDGAEIGTDHRPGQADDKTQRVSKDSGGCRGSRRFPEYSPQMGCGRLDTDAPKPCQRISPVPKSGSGQLPEENSKTSDNEVAVV